MSAWAVAMFRDEADVAEYVVRHMLAQELDGLIIADNLSTDDTRPILESIAAEDSRLVIVDDPELGYYQARKMNHLAGRAAELGATWVLPFDADELWYSDYGTLGEVLRDDLPVDVWKTWGFEHRARHDDPDDPNPFTRIQWRETFPQHLPKVAFRWHPGSNLHVGNHDVDMAGRRDTGLLAFRHFAARSREQYGRKLRQGRQALEATNLSPLYGSHWRTMGSWPESQLDAEWERLCTLDGLIHDPAPYVG